MSLSDKVLKTAGKYGMLQGKKSVLAGLSGGPDSVALLSVLSELHQQFGFKLSAVYVDHGLRPQETPAEAAFCKNLCEGLGVEFHTEKIDVNKARAEGENLQEAARELRYAAFERTALVVEADALALGHNADDQVETFLMRLLRGSGMKGLCGIPPVRKKIIRPLIETSRADIEHWLKEKGLNYMLDSSNLKTDYTRNRLRAELIPVLKEFNPNIEQTVLRTAGLLTEEELWLDRQAALVYVKSITERTDTKVELYLRPLESADRVLIRRALRKAVGEVRSLRALTFEHIESVAGLIKNAKPGQRLSLPGGVRAVMKYNTILITTDPPVVLQTREFTPPGSLHIPEAELMLSADIEETDFPEDYMNPPLNTAHFDLDKLVFPLIIRSRLDGDAIRPAGLGGTKKLQDIFVDLKVPRDERDSVPVVVTEDEVAWVGGYTASEAFSVTSETKKVLVLTLRPALKPKR